MKQVLKVKKVSTKQLEKLEANGYIVVIAG